MSGRNQEAPVTRQTGVRSSELGDTTTTHPAFAAVMVSKPNGQHRFFGSDIQHPGGVRLKISRAEMRRSLCNDTVWDTETLIEVVMSDSQWARVIASAGVGATVPVTLSRIRDNGELVAVPEIAPAEATRSELFGEELRKAASERIASVSAALEELSAHIEGGKLSKVELRRLVNGALHNVASLPNTAKFVMDQFVEHVEDVATAAQNNVDGYVATRIAAAGLSAMAPAASIKQLQDNSEP